MLKVKDLIALGIYLKEGEKVFAESVEINPKTGHSIPVLEEVTVVSVNEAGYPTVKFYDGGLTPLFGEDDIELKRN